MWLLHLKDAGLVPKNVNHHIIFVRLYLRWLYENDAINAFPDDLIRVSDMVKEPKYLPRPLSPSADEELQRRLKDAGDLYSLGLLLMRKTGIRNGELRSLENNCIRRDHRGNVFLKVPLGKLDNERLVPIDKNTEELIERIRSQGETPAEMRFLLETKKRTQTRYPSYIAALKKPRTAWIQTERCALTGFDIMPISELCRIRLDRSHHYEQFGWIPRFQTRHNPAVFF
jgi:integrase